MRKIKVNMRKYYLFKGLIKDDTYDKGEDGEM